MNDHDRIARVIAFLQQHRTAQPDLNRIAAHAGLSPTHLHRLFKRWMGITPKDFLQILTFDHARELLRAGRSVLDAALDSGLSGPGRLHDLTIQIEAVTPGELKSGGAGLTVVHGFSATPLGEWLVAETPRGICRVAFIGTIGRSQAVIDLRADWPRATHRNENTVAERLAKRAFQPLPATGIPTVRVNARGSAFDLRVWRALVAVPPGTAVSYGDLAAAIGCPAGARAVGRAVAHNPVALLIPCHRVIRGTASIGEYRWGFGRKHALLAWETARAHAGIPSCPP